MTADQNKEISYIAYNHANMPTHVQMNNGEVLFTYDALGNKWYKRVGDYQHDEKHGTAYIFGMQYEFKYNDYIQYDWKLMFIGTDEGYVSAVYPEGIDSKFKFQYVYNHTDHLGNIRQNITRENGRLTVLREHNYYPFGLLHKGYNEEKEDLKYDKEQDFIFTVQAQAGRYKYKFQGQERQEDLDLGWDSFKYRNYDYAIGRFFNVDPLAEKFPYNGVYNFSENRVVDGVELEGKESMWFGYQGVPQNKIDEANREMARQSGTVLKWLIRTFTPVEDIYGVVTGKYFDGKKYNRAEAATWALIGLIPGGKFFKSFKVVKSLKFSKKVEGLVKIPQIRKFKKHKGV